VVGEATWSKRGCFAYNLMWDRASGLQRGQASRRPEMDPPDTGFDGRAAMMGTHSGGARRRARRYAKKR